MSKTVVSKGKNVKEAVKTGLELLEASTSEVDIEIIEPESKGFLGLGSKPAVVRLTVKTGNPEDEPVPDERDQLEGLAKAALQAVFSDNAYPGFRESEPEDDTLAVDLYGKAWVKDGHIFCKNAPDQYAVIAPKPGVRLFKNNELIDKAVVVNENDIVTADVRDEVHEPKWEIVLGNDGLEALLNVTPGYYLRRKLKDREPSNYIEIEIAEQKEHRPIQIELVIKALKELGVMSGIDFKEAARACGSEEAGSFVVARGVKAEPGTNGYFVPIKELEVKKGFKARPDGSIDYREIQQFPSVQRGQVIGIIHPPVPGKSGKSVTGKPILPDEVYPLTVAEGRGIALVEAGKVVATEEGQPIIKTKGRHAHISVVPKLTVPNDVNLKVGNVRYAGAVDVLGSVQDGMLVEAFGNVTVEGNVNMAKISSGSSISVRKNVITGEITAGKSSLLVQELNHTLGELHDQLGRMVGAMEQIMSLSAFKASTVTRSGLGSFFKILCDGKFKAFPSLVNTFCNTLKTGNGQLDNEWLEIGDSLYKNFITPHLCEMDSIGDVHRLVKRIGHLHKRTAIEDSDPDCLVKAYYVQNSKVYSEGDIHIFGDGTFNSQLYAKGTVQVEGFVRGGDIFAEKGIIAKEAGSRGGLPTRLRVPAGQTIKMSSVHENTVIQIGNKTHTFALEASTVIARLTEDGSISIQNGR